MKTYKAVFTGRAVGAIGVFHQIETTVEGADEKAANLALYDRYEHISGLVLTPITARNMGAKGLKKFARRFSLSDWQTICGDTRGWGLADKTEVEAEVITHEILNS